MIQSRQRTTTDGVGRDATDILCAAVDEVSEPGMEEALYDIESVRRFAGMELGEEEIPDESQFETFATCWKSTS